MKNPAIEKNTVINGDCLVYLQALPDKSIDMILTDPPYGKHTHNEMRTNRTELNGLNGRKESVINFDELSGESIKEIFSKFARVARKWVVSFLDYNHVLPLSVACNTKQIPLDFVRFGIWDKQGTECPQLSGDRPAQGWEGIAICHVPGRKAWGEKKRKNAVYRGPTVKGSDHPTPKPVNLMAEIIQNFSVPGDLILDPFAGSGTTAIAALRMGRDYICIEKNPKYYQMILDRIAREQEGNLITYGENNG